MSQMRLRECHHKIFRTFMVWTLVAHVLFIIAAAASPALHEWMHHDADHADHDCAITLFASGGYEHGPTPVCAPMPLSLPIQEKMAVESQRIAASFRYSGILEHAPPRHV